jgi:isopenicillin N synthase-like dioxygenase
MPVAQLPLVDFGPFNVDEGVVIGDEPTSGQLQVAASIDAACRDHGFLLLTNFGLDIELQRRAFGASAELFGQSPEQKDGLARHVPATNIGFAPFQTEVTGGGTRDADLKEAFNVRSRHVYDNNFACCPPSFEPMTSDLWDAAHRAAVRYILACELASGVERGFFLKCFEQFDLSTMRFLHYPPCDVPEPSAGTTASLRVAEHTDFGMFTFLLLGDGARGLQVKPVEGGTVSADDEGWLDVQIPAGAASLPEGCAIVNTGAQLAQWTNDVWRATAHRVVVPDIDAASQDRYCAPLLPLMSTLPGPLSPAESTYAFRALLFSHRYILGSRCDSKDRSAPTLRTGRGGAEVSADDRVGVSHDNAQEDAVGSEAQSAIEFRCTGSCARTGVAAGIVLLAGSVIDLQCSIVKH